MVWEDQGLYFTLIFNGIVVTVGLIVGYVINKSPDNHRVMRPNRPKSENATLFEGPHDTTHVAEDTTLTAVGVQPYMYVAMLKMMAFMFFSLFITSITITAVSATDDYNNVFNWKFDPKECRGKSTGDCGDSPFCSTIGSSCQPKIREGLFDFSVANVAPESWRLYLVAVASLLGSIFTVLIVKKFAEEVAGVIRRTYTTKTCAALPCSGLASVGARTVLVSGIASDSLLLDDRKMVHAYLTADDEGRVKLLEDKLPEKEKDDKKDNKKDSQPTSVAPESVKPEELEQIDFSMPSGDADLSDKSCVLAQRVDPNTIVSLRNAPDDMIALIEEEKGLLTELTDAVAAQKQEEDEEKKQKAQKSVDEVKEKLAETREKLREKVPEVPEQDYTGAIIFTFDRASTAFAFVKNFNEEQPPQSQAVAQILGHRDGVVWTNLGVSKALAAGRFVIMCLVFVLLVFFWSIPVGFLGSLENLAGLPAVGPPFAWLVTNIPVTILGILTAYLPTIVITVFNILLPSLFRFFGRLGGLKTVDAETRSVILMCAVFSIMSGIVMQAALQGGLSQLAGVISNPNTDTIIALIIAVVSPQGGYWYAYLISAACLGNVLKLLLLGPLIVSKIFGKLAGRQEAYDRLFEPRETDYAFLSGRHLFFYAIAMLFHGTVPFLVPFGFLYCILAYMIERSVLIDGAKPDGRTVVDFAFAKAYMHSIITLYLIAVLGACLVCFLKINIGAGVISVFAVVGAVACHIVVHRTLAPMVWPEPEQVKELEGEMEGEMQPTDAEPRYVPDYVTYAMDEEAVANIEAAEYPAVDTVWHERDGDAPADADAAAEKA